MLEEGVVLISPSIWVDVDDPDKMAGIEEGVGVVG